VLARCDTRHCRPVMPPTLSTLTDLTEIPRSSHSKAAVRALPVDWRVLKGIALTQWQARSRY
jgi:hypothetical protein